MTNEFDYEDMTDEELMNYHLDEAAEHAKITLQMAENCERRFGKKLLSDAQKGIFQKVANGAILTDEEMETLENEEIRAAMIAIKEARQTAMQASERLGEAYEPELLFEDQTEGFRVN